MIIINISEVKRFILDIETALLREDLFVYVKTLIRIREASENASAI